MTRGDTQSVRRALIVAYIVACLIGVIAGAIVTRSTSAEPILWRFQATGPGLVENITRCNLAPEQCEVSHEFALLDNRRLPFVDVEGDILAVACSVPGPVAVTFTNSVLWWQPGFGRVTGRSESLPPIDLPDVSIPRLLGVDFPGQSLERDEACGLSNVPFPEFNIFTPDVPNGPFVMEYGIRGEVVGGADVQVASQTVFVGERAQFDAITTEVTPLPRYLRDFSVADPLQQRQVPLFTIWGTVLAGALLLGLIMGSVAVPALGAATNAEALAISEAAATKLAEARAANALMIGQAANHELARHIVAAVQFYPFTRDLSTETATEADRFMVEALDGMDVGMRGVQALSLLGSNQVVQDRSKVALDDLFVDAPLPVVIESDGTPLIGNADILRLAMRNIVENSVVHGQASQLTVTRSGRFLTIEDDGAGMTFADAEAAWLHGIRVMGDGVGLGLALVRRIVASHEATAALTSAPGEGVHIEIQDL